MGRSFDRLAAAAIVAVVVLLAVCAQARDRPAAELKKFFVEDIKSTMEAHVGSHLDADGFLRVHDDKTGETLALKFVKIHDPVRHIRGSVYFACTDFHVEGDPEKLYDIDFWMDGKTGELVVYETKVHKEPRRSLLYGWFKQPRYTFVDDEIEYLY